MAEKSILFDLQLNTKDLEGNAQRASERLKDLRDRQKELKEAGETNTVEYAKLSNEIRANNKVLKDASSALEIQDRLAQENNGTLAEMREALKAGSIAYAQLTEEQRENEDIGGKLQQQNADLKTSINELEQAQKNFTGSVGNYKEATTEVLEEQRKTNVSLSQMGDTMGGLPGPVGKATNSIKTMSKSLKALLANPVVLVISAIVGALALLTKAFTRSEEGSNKMDKALAVLSSVFDTIMDVVTDVADLLVDAFENPQQAIKDFSKLIVDNIMNRFTGILELIPNLGKAITLLFKGQFSEAGQVALDAVAKVALGVEDATAKLGAMGDKIDENARKRARASDLNAKATKLERDLIVERSEADRKRAELLEKAEQRDKFTREQRVAFLKEAGKIDEDITAKEIEAAGLRLEAIKLINSASKSGADDKKAEAEATARLNDLETKRLSKQKEVTTKIVGFIEQERAERKRLHDEQVALSNTLTDIILANEERNNDLQLAIINQKYDALLRSAQDNSEQIIELEKQKNEELKALDKEREQDAIASLEERLRREIEANKGNAEIQKELTRAFEIEKAKIEIEFDNAQIQRENNVLDLIAAQKLKTEVEVIEEVAEKEIEVEKMTAQQKTELALSSANQLSGALFQIVQSRLTNELNALTTQFDAQTDALNDQLEQGLISENEYLNQKANLEEEYREEERKLKQEQFEKQKQADLIQAIINGALAVSKALASAPPPLNFALAGISATLTGVQTALIASQPTPKFAKGGVFGGNPHSAGGTLGTFSDGTQIEVEKDEAFFVLNKKATSKIGALSRLNQSTGGVPLMANGGGIDFNSGITAINLSNQIDQKNNTTNDIINAMSKLPNPVVAVQDINQAQSSYSSVVNFASF